MGYLDAIGSAGSLTVEVRPEDSADAFGNEGLAVLATPALVGLFERAAMRALDGLLESGERTVGSVVDVVHEAPTPVGAELTVTATLDSVGGAQLWFVVRAHDAAGQIASGRHSRFVVNDERFRGTAAKRIGAPDG